MGEWATRSLLSGISLSTPEILKTRRYVRFDGPCWSVVVKRQSNVDPPLEDSGNPL